MLFEHSNRMNIKLFLKRLIFTIIIMSSMNADVSAFIHPNAGFSYITFDKSDICSNIFNDNPCGYMKNILKVFLDTSEQEKSAFMDQIKRLEDEVQLLKTQPQNGVPNVSNWQKISKRSNVDSEPVIQKRPPSLLHVLRNINYVISKYIQNITRFSKLNNDSLFGKIESPKEASSGRQTPSKYSSAIDEYNVAKETIARGVWRWITRDYENPDRGHSNINNVGANGAYGVPGILTHLSIKGLTVTTAALIGLGILTGINTITGLKHQNRINSIEEDMEEEQSTMESLESKVSNLESSCSPGGMSAQDLMERLRAAEDSIASLNTAMGLSHDTVFGVLCRAANQIGTQIMQFMSSCFENLGKMIL